VEGGRNLTGVREKEKEKEKEKGGWRVHLA